MYILLARHGETPWNKEGRYQGHTDIELSPDGEAQARSLAKRLENLPLARAVSSPLKRARRTAEIALGDRASLLRTDDALREISHGGWEGKLVTEIAAQDAELLRKWKEAPTPDLPAGPNAETLKKVLDRSWLALGRACQGLRGDEAVLVVAHDAVNRVLLCKALGLPLERVWSFRQAPATLNVLEGMDVEHLQVVRLNDADHVAPLFHEAVHAAV